MIRPLAAGLLALAAFSLAWSEDPPQQPAGAGPVRQELDAVRDQLVALDIEKALAALAAILERPELTDAERVDALDFRAQAHAAGDDLDAVAKDYRAILELRASYAPEPAVTSKKAMERFARLRAEIVGTVHLDVDPKDAAVTVDDRPVTVSAEGSFPVVAGERRLRFSRRGFDPLDDVVHAVAGSETLVKIRMVPNARTLVVRTDVEGVAVSLDGAARGVTARPAGDGSAAAPPPALELEDVAIGEHEIGLVKSCFAAETVQAIVSVDLADRSPKLLPLVTMRPARTRVTATGAQYDGELRVDGEQVASLPLTSFSMCPGERTLEVVASGRVVFSGTMTAEESDVSLDLTPRPNVVLVGAAWPKSWSGAVAAWSVRPRIDPPAGVELATREGWAQVVLPPGTDLAVAVLPNAGVAGEERTVLYSPTLHEVEDPVAPPTASRPSWVAATIGIVPVDAGSGVVLLGGVTPDGPAGKAGLLPGDRILAIAGRPVTSASAARDAVAGLRVDATVVLDVASPSQESRKVECAPVASPRVTPLRGDGGGRAVRAAWAAVDATAGPDVGVALANLAALLESAGEDAAALEAWRKARAVATGALAARASYAVGAGLQAGGKRAEAIEAFNQAETGGLSGGDPALAQAAIDRLRDLGVTAP